MSTTRVVVSTGVLAALIAMVGSAQGPAVPRTPWGDPDLQGTFSSEAELSVPFERPAQYGERRFLNDAEYAQRRAQADKQLLSDNSDFDLETADRSNAGAVGSATSPPPHWLERGKVSRRTSLLIDPPDGRLPPLAQSRPAAGRGRGAARRHVCGTGLVRRHRHLQRSRGSEPLGAVHQPRHSRRDVPDGLQREPANRAVSGAPWPSPTR